MPRSIRNPGARVALLVVLALLVAAAAGAWLHRRSASPPPAGDLAAPPDSSASAVVPRLAGAGWSEVDDPARDGRDTEVFATKAGDRLKALARMVLDPGRMASPELSALVSADFSCGALRPARLEVAFDDGGLRVERAAAGEDPAPTHRGPQGLGKALEALALPFHGAGSARCDFK